MKLSVVIVSYNASSFLDQTIKTLKTACSDIETEIFVVDNASSDDCVEMVRRCYPEIKLIANNENVGFARANNQALELVVGEYVLLLNPDTVLRKDTLDVMLGFMDSHPEAGASGCKVINPDGSLQLACRRGFPTPGVAFFKMIGLSGLFPKSKTFGAYNLTYLDPESVAEVDAVSGAFMMLRKSALDKVGFLDKDFFMYGEDLDLCYRIKKAGWKIFYVPYTEIIHFKGESTKTVPTIKSVRNFYTAMHIFVSKHYGNKSRDFIPQSLVVLGIYLAMGWVYGLRMLKSMKQPALDLVLLNISLILGLSLRFGFGLESAPGYSQIQWITIFLVYSTLYMTAFFSIGLYNRYRYDPGRALFGIFIGFLLNVFIVYFIKHYNFSRIASFYCWGFNAISISGWRFALQLVYSDKEILRRSRTIILGKLEDAANLKKVLIKNNFQFEIAGCVEISKNAIRGSELEGVRILGLVDELGDIIKEYGINEVIIAGQSVPFSKILGTGKNLGFSKPGFRLVPEFKNQNTNDDSGITMIDINPGRMFGNGRR